MGNNSIPVCPDDASLCKLTIRPVATRLRLSHYDNELLIVRGWSFSVLSERILEFLQVPALQEGLLVLIGPFQFITGLPFTP